MINLLYHATIYYEVRKYIQESEPATLTYEMVIEKAKAHEHNVLEYKDHQASHGGANSHKTSQLQRHSSMESYSGQGKGGGKHQQQKKKTPKKPPKQNAYEVMFKNSVLSKVTTRSGGERENHGKVSSKTVLSGPEEEGMYKRFSCFAVHSKMSQSTNAKSKPLEGLYTDTDPDNRSEIMTDITIRMPGKAVTMMMEVKVDPGVQPSCIPLHKFKTLFPHLCRDGLPKEGLLDNTQNEFQSYNGGDMMCYGRFLIDVKDKVTKKYHPIRFYVMNTDVPRILISHAASYWLGLRDQQQHITILKQVASQPQNQPRPVSAPPVANVPLPPYP